MSVDPLAEQFPGWNPYHYVHNNPINLIDPTGMSAEPPTEGEFTNGYVHTDSDGSWTYNNGIWGDNSGGGNDFAEGINFTVSANGSNETCCNGESSDLSSTMGSISSFAGAGLSGYSAYNGSNGMFRGASGNYYNHAGRKGWNQYTGTKAQMNSTLSKAKWASRGATALGVVNYGLILNDYTNGQVGGATFGVEMTSNTIGTFTPPIISIPWTIGYEGLGRNGVARIPWYQNTFKPWARKKLGIDE